MDYQAQAGGFVLSEGAFTLAHSAAQPCLFIGSGREQVEMLHGNFSLSDTVSEKTALRTFAAARTENGVRVTFFSEQGTEAFLLEAQEQNGRLRLAGRALVPCSRIWLRLAARPDERIYGGGEQFSYFDLRGRRFPIWTSEQGVGRNRQTLVTHLADEQDHAGGDYYWTFFPQPTFLSSAGYWCHVTDTCYTCLDFTAADAHEVHWWAPHFELFAAAGETPAQLVQSLTDLLGRPPLLPDWAMRGVWLGIQGGADAVERKLVAMQAAGTDVSAVWCQDWQGIRMTSFGKRLMWNWQYSEALYPDLPRRIAAWNARGVRFLGYINPYVCEEGALYAEAQQKNLLVRDAQGGVYRVDFGEFWCGIVDFTNPAACAWYKGVIRRNLIDIGMSGWMADFGEYLPTDCVLASGESPMELHNRWPALWARVNYEAVAESGKLGEIVYFMRAGAAGSQHDSTLMWAGDQNVDFSRDDGLISVVCAALSSGMSGCGLHTSDVGGYTTLFHMRRTKELLLRWTEFAAFTPVLRTHEGNRPGDNWQFDSDAETMRFFARFSRLHTALLPYLRTLARTCSETGLPVMRALALAYPADAQAAAVQDAFLLGSELLAAPVYEEGAVSRRVYLPAGEWRHLWSGRVYGPGSVLVDAPLGCPPVFYAVHSAHAAVFEAARAAAADLAGNP